MSVLVDILLAVIGLLFFVWWYTRPKKNELFYSRIPGAPGLPFLGNALDFRSTTEIIPNLQRYIKDNGKIFHAHIGLTRHLLVVADYKYLEFGMTSMDLLEKSDEYKYFLPWLGTGLLTSDGIKWKKHRKALTPAFHFQILEQFINTFESCGDILIEKLKTQVGKSSFDVYPFVTLCALDIICESTMGVPVDAQKNLTSDYVQMVKAMSVIIMERTIKPAQMYDTLFRLTSNYYTQKKALKVLHSHSMKIIKERREQLNNKEVEEDDTKSKKKTFLDILLKSTIDGKLLSNEEVREEVDTFMFEGHDTTSSGLGFLLFNLANHPEVQAKVLEEQLSIFGNVKNPSVTYADLQSMKYLDQVIKESMRLYPPVPLFGRRVGPNVKFGDLTLSEDYTFIIYAYGIHRDPDYYKNPDVFDPDRFKDNDGKQPYAYIPFSAGPRNCIGQKFAMLEMKSVASKVIRNFELLPATPTHVLQLAAETILRSVNGIHIALKPRQ